MAWNWRNSYFCSFRFVVALILCAGLTVSTMLTTSLTFAVVCIQHQNNNTTPYNDSSVFLRDVHSIKWDPMQLSFVLAGVFWGQFIFTVPSGKLVELFGARKVLAISVLGQAVFSFLIPFGAAFHWAVLFFFRVIQGMGQAAIQPACVKLAAGWSPIVERAKVIGIITTGLQWGGAIAMPITSQFCQVPTIAGWPLAFFVFGLIGVLWCVLFFFSVRDLPEEQPCISENERNRIVQNRPPMARRGNVKAPWSKILRSMAIWAIIASDVCLRWKLVICQVFLPIYFHQVHHFSIQSNGIVSMVPFILQAIMKLIVPFIASSLIKKKVFTSTGSVKFWNSIACYGMAICMFILSFLDSRYRDLAVVFVTLSVGLFSLTTVGCVTSMVAVGGVFAGQTTGFILLFGSMILISGPYIVNAITIHNGKLSFT